MFDDLIGSEVGRYAEAIKSRANNYQALLANNYQLRHKEGI